MVHHPAEHRQPARAQANVQNRVVWWVGGRCVARGRRERDVGYAACLAVSCEGGQHVLRRASGVGVGSLRGVGAWVSNGPLAGLPAARHPLPRGWEPSRGCRREGPTRLLAAAWWQKGVAPTRRQTGADYHRRGIGGRACRGRWAGKTPPLRTRRAAAPPRADFGRRCWRLCIRARAHVSRLLAPR